MSTCTHKLPEKLYRELDSYIDSLPSKKGALIHVLHRAQEIFGYLPVEVQQYIAEKTNIPLAKVYGVVSFYTFFTMTPRGKNPIAVCMGTACFVKGAEKVLEEFKRALNVEVGDVTHDGKFSISIIRCLGACGMAPVVMIGEKVYARVTPDKVRNILDEYK